MNYDTLFWQLIALILVGIGFALIVHGTKSVKED